ncbi:hypothetical protein BKA62DRAFT_767759 [Auriculariales sp. MPI-PUGE-AT-0066]|nr:hypothetical protein BKA62DRAFT_767759 [Auriculariales sp. MPI-PUGE-AT-0066]
MESKELDLECGQQVTTSRPRVHFSVHSPHHNVRAESLPVAAMSDSRASTDSILSQPLPASTIQDRLRQLDMAHNPRDDDGVSIASSDSIPLEACRLLDNRAGRCGLDPGWFIALLVWLQSQQTVPPPHDAHVWPLRELLVAAAACTACYALRGPVWSLGSLLSCSVEWPATAAAAVLQSLLEESARLGVFALLAFRPAPTSVALASAWWIATGFAATAAIVGISQDYAKLALYRDVLHGDSDQSDMDDGYLDTASESPELDERTLLRTTRLRSGFMRRYLGTHEAVGPSSTRMPIRRHRSSFGESAYDDAGEHLEHELEQLLAIKQRAEIEDVYGMPLPNIPVFVAALQRIDSIILAFGLTLLVGASWTRAVATRHHEDHIHFNIVVLRDMLPTFAIVVSVHAVLSLLWAVGLPRIGAPTVSYSALLVALATFFAALASWGVLS